MTEYSSEQLDVLLKAAPNNLFTGFSSISGDGICLNRALERLGSTERDLLVAVITHKGKLHAAKEIAGEGASMAKIFEVTRNINDAFGKFRAEFEKACERFVPTE